MDEAILSSDRSVSDVRDLSARQQSLQTGFIMNENRVNSARDAAVAQSAWPENWVDSLRQASVRCRSDVALRTRLPARLDLKSVLN